MDINFNFNLALTTIGANAKLILITQVTQENQRRKKRRLKVNVGVVPLDRSFNEMPSDLECVPSSANNSRPIFGLDF